MVCDAMTGYIALLMCKNIYVKIFFYIKNDEKLSLVALPGRSWREIHSSSIIHEADYTMISRPRYSSL